MAGGKKGGKKVKRTGARRSCRRNGQWRQYSTLPLQSLRKRSASLSTNKLHELDLFTVIMGQWPRISADPALAENVWEAGFNSIFSDIDGRRAVGLNPNKILQVAHLSVGEKFGKHINESVEHGGTCYRAHSALRRDRVLQQTQCKAS
ncbi:hypothetical protein R1sor_023758 [Riccia sorocarpa]|uniref:Uncharacterized protein n=1 Tax=Riccia sorocarpa TaxID=122646 RepID=A0ABD3GQQ5_9MARC